MCTTVVFKFVIPGQLSHLDLLIRWSPYRIVAVYGPSDNDDPTFFNDNLSNKNVIQYSTATVVMRDFKAVQTRALDTFNYISDHCANPTKAINTGILEYILSEPFRERNPRTLAYR